MQTRRILRTLQRRSIQRLLCQQKAVLLWREGAGHHYCRGIPVECCFVPGSEHDSEAISQLLWDFKAGDRIYDDSGYTCYAFEDIAADAGIDILTARKKNTKRKDQPYEAWLKDYYRKQIETSFSGITNLMPKALHAVTPEGFFIKALLFVMAYQFSRLIQSL